MAYVNSNGLRQELDLTLIFHYVLIKIRLKFNHNSSRDHFGLIYGSFWDALRVTLDFFGIILQLLCGHLGHVRATVGYFEVTSGLLWGDFDFEDMAVRQKKKTIIFRTHFNDSIKLSSQCLVPLKLILLYEVVRPRIDSSRQDLNNQRNDKLCRRESRSEINLI